jgi:hypothetical protein
MKTISKEQQIKNHFKNHGTLTSLQAFKLYKVTRLAAIVFRMREAGYLITSLQPTNCNYVIYKYTPQKNWRL